jgi:hypothetical protein
MSQEDVEAYLRFVNWRRANRAVQMEQVVRENESELDELRARRNAAELKERL